MPGEDNLKPALVVFGVMLATAGVALIVKHRVNAEPDVDDAAVAVQRFEQLTDDMCACRDAKCAQQVSEQMTAWGSKLAKDKHVASPDEETQQRMTKLAERMATCMQKALAN